ncbi:tRNA (adenosine(37)-N6)-threonylcarbamoyltransferase complex dimerization subunit type 1 TsaB [Candidatus Saccharibacteria bacterium CPR2]|nr:tRNA (adenosine(37)-N6)-threonylcarbamoyltransferase complex dimerization subunit type 1 TsaB [Candidatus Saccharibacteria bacterium CPR2]
MSLVLTIRTDKPKAEIRLWQRDKLIAEKIWYAHKQLSVDILREISNIITKSGNKLQDLSGIVVYKGPGSFTGLRIGITVANTFAYSLNIPIIGETGEDWQLSGMEKLRSSQDDKIVVPFYGGEANITKPRK